MNWDAINLASPDYARPSEPPAIFDLIYTGLRHVISGPPESLKTIVALIVALEHVRAGGHVAYVDFENGPIAVRRMLDDLGATDEELRAFAYYEPGTPPSADVIDEITTTGITLVIIAAAAGAYDASGLDDNKRADAERFAGVWVKPLWVNEVTTIVLDHVTKDKDTRGKFTIGSERKIGGADIHLGLDAITQLSRGTTGLVRVTTHKDRPGHLRRPTAVEIQLTSDPDTNAITWEQRPPSGTSDGDGFRPTVLIDRVLQHVGHYDYEPVSRTELVGAITGKREWLFKAIEILLAEGQLALNDHKVVPGSRNVPGTGTADERGNEVP